MFYRARAAEQDDAPETKKSSLTSPPPPPPTPTHTTSSNSGGELAGNEKLSPEQLSRMEQQKATAEARLLAKRLGGAAIGASWMQALQREFKKGYIEKVTPPPPSAYSTLLCEGERYSLSVSVDFVCG